MHAVGLALEPFEKPFDAVEAVRTADDLFLRCFIEFFKGQVGGDLLPATKIYQIKILGTIDTPRFDRTLAQRQPGVGNDQIQIDPDGPAKPPTLRAGPQSAVEGKEVRCRRRDGFPVAASRTGKVGTEPYDGGVTSDE